MNWRGLPLRKLSIIVILLIVLPAYLRLYNLFFIENRFSQRIFLETYHTYDELFSAMQKCICSQPQYDAVIHSAAVSDYQVEGTYLADKKDLQLSNVTQIRIINSFVGI